MAEPRPQDLRRLQSLETRLAKATDDRKSLAAERKELRAAVAANATRAKLAEETAERTAERLDKLVEENAQLAAARDQAVADAQLLETTGARLRAELTQAVADAKTAKRETARLAKELASAGVELERGRQALAVARAQLESDGADVMLPTSEVAELVDSLIGDFSSRMPGLGIRDGELRLKVAFGRVGDQAGLVLPTPTSPAPVLNSLQDITLRFDRSAAVDAASPPTDSP